MRELYSVGYTGWELCKASAFVSKYRGKKMLRATKINAHWFVINGRHHKKSASYSRGRSVRTCSLPGTRL